MYTLCGCGGGVEVEEKVTSFFFLTSVTMNTRRRPLRQFQKKKKPRVRTENKQNKRNNC